MSDGHFLYIGLETALIENLLHFDLDSDTVTVIKIDINIDGLPFYKSLNQYGKFGRAHTPT